MSSELLSRKNIAQSLIENVPKFLTRFGGTVNLTDDQRYIILRKAAKRFLQLQRRELGDDLAPETAQDLENYSSFLNVAFDMPECTHVGEILARAFFENIPDDPFLVRTVQDRLNARARRLCAEVMALREEDAEELPV